MIAQRLPSSIADRLRLPLIAAPMLHVSGPELVIAACHAGVVGAFPTANARDVDTLRSWLVDFAGSALEGDAPFCPNLIIRDPRMPEHLKVLLEASVEMVITSVGSPAPVIAPLHEIGCLVFADVATLKHAQKAVAEGIDGLILLSAGAGGQTGRLNPLAYVRAVRRFFDGPIVLAGGIADGHALRAAITVGADLAYMGTRFIATRESLASDGYREMLRNSTMDDILLTKAFSGLETSMLLPSIVAAGIDPSQLDEQISPADAKRLYGGTGPARWKTIWSAGHSVSGVERIGSVADLVEETLAEYTDTSGSGQVYKSRR